MGPAFIGSPIRRALRRVRRTSRAGALRLASHFSPGGDAPPPDPAGLHRILLVGVHTRLGNTVLATPAVAAVRAACPDAEIDLLGGPAAPAVLEGFGLRRVDVVHRRDALSPRRLLARARILRAAHYDAAFHLSTATGSLGALLVGASGATHRLGCRRPEGNVWFTTAVPPPAARHKVDALREYLAHLGIPVAGGCELRLRRDEIAWAEGWLAARDGGRPGVAVFLGGRGWQGKSWDVDHFAAVARGLSANGLRPVLLPGPEERFRLPETGAGWGDALAMDEPGIRKAAALVRCCRVALTPDSGPMHVAIAVGTPVVAIFRRPNADKWGPGPGQGHALFEPEGRGAERALASVLSLAGRLPPGEGVYPSEAVSKRSSSSPL